MKRNVVLILSYYKAPAEHTQQQQRKFLLQYQTIRTVATFLIPLYTAPIRINDEKHGYFRTIVTGCKIMAIEL
jgi:hypothetical protein